MTIDVGFSKNELNYYGYKLGFFDSSFLFDFFKLEPAEYKKLVKKIKYLKIRPIVNILLIGELLKGLNPEHKKYEQHVNNKIKIMEFFDEFESLWIDEHPKIPELELESLYYGKNEIAHDKFKIFCSVPFKKFFEYIVQNELKSFQNDFNSGVFKNNSAKSSIRDSEDPNKIEKVDKGYIFEFLKNHLKLEKDDKKIEILMNTPIDVLKSSAPFCFVENNIFWRYVVKNEENDFIDSMYARIALSYGDYFLVCDRVLKDVCQKAIDEMQLKVELLDLGGLSLLKTNESVYS